MHEARSGHSLVFHQNRKMVFAIGGLVGGSVSSSAEVYSIEHSQWFKLEGNLKV